VDPQVAGVGRVDQGSAKKECTKIYFSEMMDLSSRHINTSMKTASLPSTQTYSHFFAQRFHGKRSCYIRFDLNISSIQGQFREAECQRIARKFRNNLSRLYFGNAARHSQKYADLTIHLHQDDFWHFHIVAEVPEDKEFSQVRSFAEMFVIKNRPLTVPRKMAANGSTICYFEPTESLIGSQIYNGRFGLETALIF